MASRVEAEPDAGERGEVAERCADAEPLTELGRAVAFSMLFDAAP